MYTTMKESRRSNRRRAIKRVRQALKSVGRLPQSGEARESITGKQGIKIIAIITYLFCWHALVHPRRICQCMIKPPLGFPQCWKGGRWECWKRLSFFPSCRCFLSCRIHQRVQPSCLKEPKNERHDKENAYCLAASWEILIPPRDVQLIASRRRRSFGRVVTRSR